MTRFRFLAILLCALVACPFLNSQSNQDKNKEKHAAPVNQPQQQSDQHNRRPQKPADKGKSLAPQKQIERSPEQTHDQQRTQNRAWQERRANHWEYERRTWRQRGGYTAYVIPEDYFRSHYGLSNQFRIYSLPFIYEGGNPRFQYGGLWFTMLDPCPEFWGGRWYETDDMYLDFSEDGYYLFNRSFPGKPGIAVSVSS
jgi:hypothetical protein